MTHLRSDNLRSAELAESEVELLAAFLRGWRDEPRESSETRTPGHAEVPDLRQGEVAPRTKQLLPGRDPVSEGF